MEVVRRARDKSGITHVDFNSDHYDGDTYLDILEPYLADQEGAWAPRRLQTPSHRT
jgi:hypothetical protein